MRPAAAPRWVGLGLGPARLAGLFVFALALSLHYGRRGYMPLDQSIIFDGGWRLLSGQVPFRDFHTPNGLVPDAMQAVFFALLGVTWFAYCLHAAVMNGLFAVLVQRLLASRGLGPWTATLYAALSAVVFYPPFGVPYMDQHAFFFSLLAVHLALRARATESERARGLLWLAVPLALVLASLSKQIPSVFALPVVLALALAQRGPALRGTLVRLAASSLALVALLALGAWILDVDFARLNLYFRELPGEEGARRLKFVPTVGAVLERMWQTGETVGMFSINALHVVAGLGLAIAGGLALSGRTRRFQAAALAADCALAEALLLTCLLFVALTSNQPEIGVPLVFVSVGLVHRAAFRLRDGLAEGDPLGLRLTALWLVRILIAALALVAVRDAWHFNGAYNETRKVSDLEYDPAQADAAQADLPEALSFMRYQTPVYRGVPGTTAGELRDVAAWLSGRDEEFLLIGDSSVLYGITKKRSTSPSLWWHPGLLLPFPDDPRFAAYEDLILEQVEHGDLRIVVLEGPATWIGRKLADFPRLSALVDEKTCERATFGRFEVYRLCP